MKKLFYNYVTGPITQEIIPSCFLCGEENNLTKEHILPKWVFESDKTRIFITDVNQLSVAYISATLPACHTCNSRLLNSLERSIQKSFSEVNFQKRKFSKEEWENIIRWLEIIDFKFQVYDISRKFLAHKNGGYIKSLSDVSIAFMRDLSIRKITSKARTSLKRIATKSKESKLNSLLLTGTVDKTFNYFHTSGEFIYFEIPKYNMSLFYFFEKEFATAKQGNNAALKIINTVYN